MPTPSGSAPESSQVSRERDSKPPLWRVGTLTYTTAGLVALFAWLLWGDFAWSMKERSVPPVMQLLLRMFGASDTLNGVLIGSLPAAIALILAPIISYRSDRHRGKWGRRIPFLLITTPITSLTMVGLAFSPWLGERLHLVLAGFSPGLNTCVLIVIGFCWTLFEFATIAANAIFSALVNDVVPQPVIGRFFGMFRALSLIAAMIFNYWLIGTAETYYMWIFIGLGLLYGVGFTTMCLKVKEGDYPPPPPVETVGGKKRGFLSAATTYLHECFGHSYYIWFFLAFALGNMCLLPVNLFSVFYAKSINMSMDAYGMCLTLTYFVSLCLAYPLGALADKIHPLRLTIITLSLYVVTAIWGGIFARDASNFAVAFIAHGVISGTYFTAVASLPQRLLARSRFAELLSAAGIVNSLGFIGFPFVVGPLLDALKAGDSTKQVYHNTFLLGGAVALLAVGALLVLHSKFMARGGPKAYVAPEDEDYDERATLPAPGGNH